MTRKSLYISTILTSLCLLGCSSEASVSVNEAPSVSENTISENTVSENTVSENEVVDKNDLDPYYVGTTRNGHTIQNIEGLTYIDGVLIANKTYNMPEDYDPGDLLPVVNAAFVQMKEAAKEEGINLEIISGYRSYDVQNQLYFYYVGRSGGIEVADGFSARPGYSEHQTGMAMDLNSCLTSFGETKAGIWLRENCADYGFILRYPEGKEEITGYIYEPWHFRYVGLELAKEITDSGLCLEEFFGIDSEYSPEANEYIAKLQEERRGSGGSGGGNGSGGGGGQTVTIDTTKPYIDPVTGWLVDPSTGFYYDPATGLPIDVNTGLPIGVLPDETIQDYTETTTP